MIIWAWNRKIALYHTPVSSCHSIFNSSIIYTVHCPCMRLLLKCIHWSLSLFLLYNTNTHHYIRILLSLLLYSYIYNALYFHFSSSFLIIILFSFSNFFFIVVFIRYFRRFMLGGILFPSIRNGLWIYNIVHHRYTGRTMPIVFVMVAAYGQRHQRRRTCHTHFVVGHSIQVFIYIFYSYIHTAIGYCGAGTHYHLYYSWISWAMLLMLRYMMLLYINIIIIIIMIREQRIWYIVYIVGLASHTSERCMKMHFTCVSICSYKCILYATYESSYSRPWNAY